jgi:putative transposase
LQTKGEICGVESLNPMYATSYEGEINCSYLPPENLWRAVEPLLPEPPKGKRGRPAQCNRKMFFAIYYVLRTSMQWKALPRCLGAASTVHDRFQQWVEAGVFYRLWESGLMQLHVEDALNWEFQSIDGCQTKAPLGGEAVGPNPTDRAKGGVKRHLLTEAAGLPVGLAVTGANVHDIKKVQDVLEQMPFLPPFAELEYPQHFCADKGYDSKVVRSFIARLGYEDHIKSRWEEKQQLKTPGYRARRWVCERTHSWLNRFRRLLIRWEKKVANYEAFLHLACAFIIWRRSEIFG